MAGNLLAGIFESSDGATPYLFDPRHRTSFEPDDVSDSILFGNWGQPLVPDSDIRPFQQRIARTFKLSRGSALVFWGLWFVAAYFAVVLVKPEFWFWGDRAFAGTLVQIDGARKEVFLFFFWLGLWFLSMLLVTLSAFPATALRWSGSSFPSEPLVWLIFLSAILLAAAISIVPLIRLFREPPMDDYPWWRFSMGGSGVVSLVVLSVAVLAISKSSSVHDFDLLMFFRLANLGSGFSMMLPLMYIDFAAMMWAFSNLRRLGFAERIAPSNAHEDGLGFSSATFPAIAKLEQSVNQTVCTPYLWWLRNSLAIAVLIAGTLFLLDLNLGIARIRWHFFQATVETAWFYPIFWIGLLLMSILLTWEVAHSFALWQAFRRFLDRISGEAFVRAFKDDKDDRFLPKFSLSTSYSDLTVVRLALKEVEHDRTRSCSVSAWLVIAQFYLASLEEASSGVHRTGLRIALNRSLAKLTSLISADRQLSLHGRRFLFFRVLDYSHRIGHGLRNVIFWTNSGLFFLLLAISSYQFPNNDSLLRLGWIIMLAAIFVSTLILIEINRERVLSIFSGGTPGQIDWSSGFLFHILTLAMLPLLGVVGVQFPATFQSTANWIASLFGSVPHQ